MVFQKAASNTSHMVLNVYRHPLTVADRRTKVMIDISCRLNNLHSGHHSVISCSHMRCIDRELVPRMAAHHGSREPQLLFQFEVRRDAEQKPKPLGVLLEFERDASSGLCYCHVREIQNNGAVFCRNGTLQNLPEVANQQLQVNDRLLSVNGQCDYEGIRSQLHYACTLHLHVLRGEDYGQQQPEESNLSLNPEGSDMMISQQQWKTINLKRAPGSERNAAVNVDVVEVETDYPGDDLEPEYGYMSLSRGDLVEVYFKSLQPGDKNNKYQEYVYGRKASCLQECGWLPTAIIRK